MATVGSAAKKSADLPLPGPDQSASIDPVFDSFVRRVVPLTGAGRYQEALALCDSLRQAFPHHPAPELYTAGVLMNQMQSFRLNDLQAEMDSHVQLAIDKAKRLLQDSTDPWLSLYVGTAYSYRSLARLRRNNWLGAFLDGRRGIQHFRDALKRDPQLYDAYFALGAYHYWRTARSSFIRVVAFWMPDRRQLGLQQMALAADYGRYIRHDALHGLALALYDAGDYEDSRQRNEQARTLVEPPTTGSLYLYGRLLVQSQDWPAAELTFARLLARLSSRSVGYQVECKYWIARAMAAQGRSDEAGALATEALAQSGQRQASLEMDSVLENAATIKQWLADLVEQLTSISTATQ